MSEGLEALENIGKIEVSVSDERDYISLKLSQTKEYSLIAKELRAFEIIKDFVWIESGEIHLGLYGDSEVVLREKDFESKEKYDLLKKVLL